MRKEESGLLFPVKPVDLETTKRRPRKGRVGSASLVECTVCGRVKTPNDKSTWIYFNTGVTNCWKCFLESDKESD